MPPQGYEYVICKSSQSVQWSGNFTGQIPFTFKTPNRKWCKPRECYLAVKLRVDQLDGSGNHTPLKPIFDANGDISCYPYISKKCRFYVYLPLEKYLLMISLSVI